MSFSPAARHKRLWRERIFTIWGCDPLKCPCCGSEMRPHKPVQDPDPWAHDSEPIFWSD